MGVHEEVLQSGILQEPHHAFVESALGKPDTGGLRPEAVFVGADGHLDLGADAAAIGTAALMAIGCQQYKMCHTGKCPTGVATQNPWLVHGLDPELVYDYVSSPYLPYLTDEFTFTRDWMRETIAKIFDVQGPHGPVIEQLNMPPSFVILDRVVWGVSAILGKLEAHLKKRRKAEGVTEGKEEVAA